MWSVVKFTAQNGHFGLGSLSITAEWVALFICVHYVVWFALFHGCGRVFPLGILVVLVRLFLLSMLSSPVEDMFWCGAFLRSVLPGIPT
jgi:hypothetical protein